MPGPITIANYALFLHYTCDITNIRVEGYGQLPRTLLANIVMICDALICLWFLLHTILLSFWIRREALEGQ